VHCGALYTLLNVPSRHCWQFPAAVLIVPGTHAGVGLVVGLGVGLSVGLGVGLGVGAAVGAAVGWRVGDGVGAAVGAAVGAGVGIGAHEVWAMPPAVQVLAAQVWQTAYPFLSWYFPLGQWKQLFCASRSL
jgi:hypothetical protein